MLVPANQNCFRDNTFSVRARARAMSARLLQISDSRESLSHSSESRARASEGQGGGRSGAPGVAGSDIGDAPSPRRSGIGLVAVICGLDTPAFGRWVMDSRGCRVILNRAS